MRHIQPLNIWTTFDRAVEQHPDRVAVVDRGSQITYSDLHRRIDRLTHFLRGESIGSGDRLSILELNSLEFYIAYYAAAALGAVLCPLNYRLSNRELAFILRDSASRWLLVSTEFGTQVAAISNETALEGILWLGDEAAASSATAGGMPSVALDELPEPGSVLTPTIVAPDRPAHLYYTSGTTGRPKGVVLTHRNVCRHAEGAVAELGLDPDDRWGHLAPMFHLADAWAVFAITLVGGRHVMLPRFDAEAALRTIAQERVTISNLIPTMLNLMVKSPRVREYDLSSLRVILSGGAPIAPDVVRRIIDTFNCDYVQTYGMTETSPYLTLSLLKDHLKLLPPEDQLKYKAKTGRPFVTVELKVMREDGCSEVSRDESEVGEIWVRGETVTPGYWNRPEETRESFAGDWLRTGDLAVVDREGYVNIVDRKKDMIITGGENVYSIEVESALYEHPKVLEAAVIGVPDETWGEIVTAAVVLKPGEQASAGELVEFCKSRLAAFKAPQSIVFIRELPKTGSGKVSKMALRDRLAGRTATEEDL